MAAEQQRLVKRKKHSNNRTYFWKCIRRDKKWKSHFKNWDNMESEWKKWKKANGARVKEQRHKTTDNEKCGSKRAAQGKSNGRRRYKMVEMKANVYNTHNRREYTKSNRRNNDIDGCIFDNDGEHEC